MQEVFSKLESLKVMISELQESNRLAKKENRILVEKIESLEQENIYNKDNKLENAEIVKIKEELAAYIEEIDKILNIMS